MKMGRLPRRSFLRLCLISGGACLLAACERVFPSPVPAIREPLKPSPTTSSIPPSVTPQVKAGILIQGGDADSWSWNKLVRGTLENPQVCQQVWIASGEHRVQALLTGRDYSTTIPLSAGQNHVTAVCRHPNEHEEVSSMVTYTNRLQPRPTAIISPSLSGARLILEGGGSRPDEMEKSEIHEYLWSTHPNNPATVFVRNPTEQGKAEFSAEVSAQSVEIDFPPVNGEYYFTLRVVDQAGREDHSTTYVTVVEGLPRIPDYDRENPAWVDEAIVYGVIPRLFGSPGARAIQDKLDYLAGLGVTTLWLAPVNATIDYGYSVTDYFELRDSFGTKQDFLNLVQAAHDRGIRILMDFVPNHTSNQHPYFQDVQTQGRASNYWDLYDHDEQGKYTYYFDWPHLPNLNYDNPEVWRMMIEAFSYWVREFDVDGFRVDVAWGIRERRPDFWPEWRLELKRIKPDLLLLAEASARDPYYFDHGFDAAYDWTDQLGHWAWGAFWGEQAPAVDSGQMVDMLANALTNPPAGYHSDALVFRFLNNNDTGTRFIATHGLEMTQVATALLLSLPGIPCIYTGDELGQWFRPYYDATPISWREKYPGLLDYHKRLIGLRMQNPSLHSRLWQLVMVEPGKQVFGYLRYLEGKQQPLLVLLNFSGENSDVRVMLPDEFQDLAQVGHWQDLLSDQPATVSGSNPLFIQLAAYQARILKPA